MRSERDKSFDSLFLLYLLKQAAPIYGRTKVQKATFLVELKLREQGAPGPHFHFIRYHRGPFSRQIWDAYDSLAEAGFVLKNSYQLTDRGRFLLDLIVPDLRKANPTTFDLADKTLAWCKQKHADDLIEHVYGLTIRPDEEPAKPMKIADIPLGWDLIVPKAGGIEIEPDLYQLLLDELTMTDDQLEEARGRAAEIDKAIDERLAAAVSSGGQPS